MGLSSDGVTIKYKDATGQQRVCLASVVHVATCVRVCVCVPTRNSRGASLRCGGKKLRSTQTYPYLFCRRVTKYHVKWVEAQLNKESSGVFGGHWYCVLSFPFI